MNHKILFVSHIDSYFITLIEVVRVIKAKTSFEPVVYFPRLYPTVESDIVICSKEGIRYIRGFVGEWTGLYQVPPQPSTKSIQGIIKKIRGIIGSTFLILLYRKIRSNLQELVSICSLLDAEEYHLLVQAGDNVGYNTALFIQECHKRGIPSIIMPAWMAGPLEAFEAFQNHPSNSLRKISNRIAGVFFPDFLYERKGHRIIRWHASDIFTMKIFRVSPPKPWVLNSGFADVIIAESTAVYDYMIREGIKPDQIELMGSISNDILSKTLHNAPEKKGHLCTDLGINKNKPIILTALPPDQFYGYGRPQCEFKNYASFVEAWFAPLVKCITHNIVVSLHPSESFEKMKYIEQWGCKISRDRIINLIPLCDIFVASISATIQWAIACAKPVVNYDAYKFEFTDYAQAKGVLYTEDFRVYEAFIDRLTKDLNFFEATRTLQARDSGNWGLLDGKGENRIIELFKRLIRIGDKMEYESQK